jgi:hypothetical protein
MGEVHDVLGDMCDSMPFLQLGKPHLEQYAYTVIKYRQVSGGSDLPLALGKKERVLPSSSRFSYSLVPQSIPHSIAIYYPFGLLQQQLSILRNGQTLPFFKSH